MNQKKKKNTLAENNLYKGILSLINFYIKQRRAAQCKLNPFTCVPSNVFIYNRTNDRGIINEIVCRVCLLHQISLKSYGIIIPPL